jgi:hypothetical protein
MAGSQIIFTAQVVHLEACVTGTVHFIPTPNNNKIRLEIEHVLNKTSI